MKKLLLISALVLSNLKVETSPIAKGVAIGAAVGGALGLSTFSAGLGAIAQENHMLRKTIERKLNKIENADDRAEVNAQIERFMLWNYSYSVKDRLKFGLNFIPVGLMAGAMSGATAGAVVVGARKLLQIIRR